METMDFPATPAEFIEQYSFKDKKEVYTNGAELISVFRVEQLLEHYRPKTRFKPGEPIFIVERDEDGNACDVSGFLYLAEVAGAVIVTPKVYGCDSLEEIMDYHIEETAKDYDMIMGVYPAADCYLFRCEAQEALAAETEDDYE